MKVAKVVSVARTTGGKNRSEVRKSGHRSHGDRNKGAPGPNRV